jgi:hypothetical protein
VQKSRIFWSNIAIFAHLVANDNRKLTTRSRGMSPFARYGEQNAANE